jgi:glutamate racemase
MSDPRPIGVFDSGMGGLTVVRAIMDDLPHESVVYFGDTGRYPYGPRPLAEIRSFAVQIVRYLAGQDVKLIVVACNSATAAALDDVAAAASPIPVIAVRHTRNGRVGLIGTAATVTSGAYQRAVVAADGGVELSAQACPSFVEFVERGDTTSPALLDAARGYLAPLQEAGVDTLILGCTHYPFLRGAIHHVMGDGVLLLSSAEETADDVYAVLSGADALADGAPSPRHRFESSGDAATFAALGARFLGPELQEVRTVSMDDLSRTRRAEPVRR